MVFNFINNIFDPSNLTLDSTKQARDLVSEGFTYKEAEQLQWLQNHRNRGKYYGIAAGLFTVYTCQGTLRGYARTYWPKLYYRPWAGFLTKTFIVYVHYLLFDYLYTSKRYASNNKWTNHTIFSNRVFQDSKQALIQNFEPVNRRFTEAEKQQFLLRGESINEKLGQRNFIYNPFVHGEDEEQFQNTVRTIQKQGSRVSQVDPNVRAQIQLENQEKITNKEQLIYEPFQTLNYVDKTGEKHNLFRFWLFNTWQPII